VERLRAEVLAELGEGDADEATRLLVNRLLHEPSEALRALAAKEGQGADRAGADRAGAERLIRRLFRLAPDEDSASDEENDR
ncbi:MAG TPA: glutamyl-tRNA reductase, partial [Alphaproteobacteria bacterium]|nr:glutamyl-tRNA reductase [Alphaproteobacteria bacterium]